RAGWIGCNIELNSIPSFGKIAIIEHYCNACHADFELKSKESKTGNIGPKIADGAYHTMIERITSNNNPHLLVMTYHNLTVTNLIIIPQYFLVPGIIEERPPLKEGTRRAGWIGCNIELNSIPSFGKIAIIEHSNAIDPATVIANYNNTLNLKTTSLDVRGWMMDILHIIDKIPSPIFKLSEVYQHIQELQLKHPENHFIEAKIRQQLQRLRDKGFISFISNGIYKKNFV
ncbi:MAG: hypothetical protein K2G84_09750, partial [Muribaculaceae bacterium]|nr:hypothetical protein [Muribaculaceae bacterium]